jgi:hypothetical protein
MMLYGAASVTALTITPARLLAAPNQAAPSDASGQVQDREKAATGAYSVKDFGAAGDGKTLDTQAINRTVEAATAAGGGTVLFPPGVYLTGTVHLKSNITLCIGPGARILGSKNLGDYEDVLDPQRKNADQWHSALLEGHDLRNIAITGRGTIDGNKVFNPQGAENMRGPHAIFLNKCEGVLLQDIFIQDASNFAQLMDGCSSAFVRGVTVTGGWDGLHLLNCKDIIVTDCRFQTGDDCIAGGGWERVVVANCTLNTSCNAIRIMSPMTEAIDKSLGDRGVKNVTFTNLVITGPGIYEHRTTSRHDLRVAFLIFSTVVDNLVISNISVSKARCPLWMCVRNPPTQIRNISVNNLTATAVGMPDYEASLIRGLQDNPIESVSLSNITIVSEGGGAKDLIDKPLPDSVRDPYIPMSCYGLLCRHVKNLDLHNVRFSYSEIDARPALICESVEQLDLDGVRGQPGTADQPPIVLRDIKTLRSRGTEVPPA